jgi:CubicO group peptidase (beta-lactamase class C family)
VYHTNTYGHLLGEIVHRVDGRLPGDVLAELAATIDADIHIGLRPDELERCADVTLDPDRSILEVPDDDGTEASMILRGYFNPPGYSSFGVVNSTKWRGAQVPSTNGHGSARGLARFYDALLTDERLLSVRTLREATRAQSTGFCPVLDRDVTFGLGFQPSTPQRPFGPTPSSFGHFGTGGSVGFCDPERNLAVGYVMNHVIPRWQSSRNRALIDAIYASL